MTSHERVLSLILKGEDRFSVFCLIVNCRATCQNQCFRSRKADPSRVFFFSSFTIPLVNATCGFGKYCGMPPVDRIQFMEHLSLSFVWSGVKFPF